MSEDRPADVPEIVDGHRVIRRLGQGGMGRVLEVERLSDGRRLAMKLLLPDAPMDLVTRFEREAEAQAKVSSHPRIVTVHGFGRTTAGPWMTLELVEGDSLEERLKRGPLSADELRALLEDVGDALEHMHHHGVIHRDLKPANILRGADGRWQLADFGLARLLDAKSLSHTGELLGTPAYMAPEQVEGDKAAIGATTDVYGLGAVLYHAATGQAPFQGKSSFALLTAILKERPPPIPPLRPDLPTQLVTLLERALEKTPGDRFSAIDEMLAAASGHTAIQQHKGRVWPMLIALPGLISAALLAVAIMVPGTPALITYELHLDGDLPFFVDGEQTLISGRVEGTFHPAAVSWQGRPVLLLPDGKFRFTPKPSAGSQGLIEARGFLSYGRRSIRLDQDKTPPALSLRVAETPDAKTREITSSSSPVRIEALRAFLTIQGRDRSSELSFEVRSGLGTPAARTLASYKLSPGVSRVVEIDLPDRGETHLSVSARDLSGNETTTRVSLERPPTLHELLTGRPWTSDRLVLSEATRELKIEEGQTVLVPAGSVIAINERHFDCRGQLLILGTAESPVRFEPLESSKDAAWGGISVKGPRARLVAQHTTFLRADSTKGAGIGAPLVHQGGAIRASRGATIVLESCRFDRCQSSRSGGAIYVDGRSEKERCRLSAHGCRFSGNLASNQGGAIALIEHVDAKLVFCTFLGNQAARGGAIIVNGPGQVHPPARLDMKTCTFEHNRLVPDKSADGDGSDVRHYHGAAICLTRNSRALISRSDFTSNESLASGGAIGLANTAMEPMPDAEWEKPLRPLEDKQGSDLIGARIELCTFTKNAAVYGGAISTYGSCRLDLFRAGFYENSARMGGACRLLVTDSEERRDRIRAKSKEAPGFWQVVTMSRVDFRDNTAKRRGSVLLAEGAIALTVTKAFVMGNRSKEASPFELVGAPGLPSRWTLISSHWSSNRSASGAGALSVLGPAPVSLQLCHLSGNTGEPTVRVDFGPERDRGPTAKVRTLIRKNSFGSNRRADRALAVDLQIEGSSGHELVVEGNHYGRIEGGYRRVTPQAEETSPGPGK